MSRYNRLKAILADVAGLDESKCDRQTARRITELVSKIPTTPHPISEPQRIEREVDLILKDVRSLRKRIASLDASARSYARRAADRDKMLELMTAIADAPDDEEALRNFNEFSQRPAEEWVDFAALQHLDHLQDAMEKLGARAVELAPAGAGRRRNQHAYDVAYQAALIFVELTGKQPTFFNGGSTPFSRMLERIFAELGIKATIRKPIEAAMHKLRSNT